MPAIMIRLTEDEYQIALKLKGKRTWKSILLGELEDYVGIEKGIMKRIEDIEGALHDEIGTIKKVLRAQGLVI